MKQNHEKDSFSEYDKYWDKLDKDDNAKQAQNKPTNSDDKKNFVVGLVTVISIFVLIVLIFLIIFTSLTFLDILPFFILILAIGLTILAFILKINRRFR